MEAQININRMLITRIKRTQDGRAELFGKRHKFRDLLLFELADLADVGIDYESLPIGQEAPCRFYAYYTESGKTKKSGNPYLDVERLEPIPTNGHHNGNGHAPQEPALNGAILDELRAIHRELELSRRLLAQVLAPGSPLPEIGDGEEPPDLPEVDDGETWPGDEMEPERGPGVQAPRPQGRPLNDDQARRMFSSMAGPAIREGTVESDQVNSLVKGVVATGWRDALEKLQALIEQGEEASLQPQA